MSFSAIFVCFRQPFGIFNFTAQYMHMTPWQTSDMERAYKHPLEEAVCPLLPRNADLFIFKPFFADLT